MKINIKKIILVILVPALLAGGCSNKHITQMQPSYTAAPSAPATEASEYGTPGESESAPANNDKTQDIWETVADAYTFTFPLVLMDATAKASTNTEDATDSKAPVNQLIHSRHLANAASKAVVTPNVDTVYTQSFLDLSGDALVFHKPDADRFLSVELLDAYTNSAAILGTGGDTQAAETYLITGPDFSGKIPDGLIRVSMPTNSGWMLVRTVVDNEGDLENVYALQAEMELIPLAAFLDGDVDYIPPKGNYDPGNDFVPVEHVLGMDPSEYFDLANSLMEHNAPSKADAPALESFSEISVGPGLAFDPSVLGEDAQQRWNEMLEGLEENWMRQSGEFTKQMGAWTFLGEPIAEFGTEYAFRALVALGGLGANPVSVAIYPKSETTDNGDTLDGANNYIIHFGQDMIPPVEEYGFWSVTAYGNDDFLIDNPLNRYLINDRSDVTYNDDGSLDIFVQADPPEENSDGNNWLPVVEGPFHLYLRIYLPGENIFNGEWQAPNVTMVE